MELVAALFTATASAVGGTAATAATATAATAGAAAGWGAAIVPAASIAGAGSTALSILQGVSTVGSILMTAGATGSEMAQADLAAKENALRIKREHLQKVGSMRVAFASSGVDISAGDPLEADLADQAKFETTLAKSGGKMRATNALLRGGASIFEQGAKTSIDISRRG